MSFRKSWIQVDQVEAAKGLLGRLRLKATRWDLIFFPEKCHVKIRGRVVRIMMIPLRGCS